MELIIYNNFSKRKNSTKQPSGGTTYQVNLKDGCSVESPVFTIDGISLTANYCKWNDGYYFIDDIILSNNNIYELHCTMDVLATWKTKIGAYNTYIERSSSDYDDMVNDSMISATQEIVYKSTTNNPISWFHGTGCYIAEVMNEDGIRLYATTNLAVFGFILVNTSYTATSIAEWVDSKIAQAFDLDVYIGTIKWIPLQPSSIGTVTNTIKIGPLTGTVAGDTLYEVDQDWSAQLNVTPTLPTAYYTDFRACNPRFTEYKAYLPGVGLVTLDSALIGSLIVNSESLVINIQLDLVSGDITYMFKAGSNQMKAGQFNGNVTVNVPIGKSITDISKTFNAGVGGALSAVTSAMSGNYVGAAAGLVNTAVTVADNILSPDTTILGGSGNKALLISDTGIHITTKCFGSKEIPGTNVGRPLYEYKTINTLSGFVKCGAASLDFEGLGNEKDTVNAYLNNGFYYE